MEKNHYGQLVDRWDALFAQCVRCSGKYPFSKYYSHTSQRYEYLNFYVVMLLLLLLLLLLMINNYLA